MAFQIILINTQFHCHLVSLRKTCPSRKPNVSIKQKLIKKEMKITLTLIEIYKMIKQKYLRYICTPVVAILKYPK